MKILSLCTGYGGLDLAVERFFDAETAYVSEVDRWANRVIEERFPQAINLGDIRELDTSSMGPVDIVTAGYPCQPFSANGHRRGHADARNLWSHVARIIEALNPEMVVLENVASHVRFGFSEVLSDLAAMGRNAKWGTVRASDAGAPHKRERLFVCSVHNSNGKPEMERTHAPAQRFAPTFEDGCGFIYETSAKWGVLHPAIQRWERVIGRNAPAPFDERGRMEPAFIEWSMGLPAGWVTDVIAPRSPALQCLGNGVVPQQAYLALQCINV